MSLTANDLIDIRTIVRDEVSKTTRTLDGRLTSLEGKVAALENEVKEIYAILTRIERLLTTAKQFIKLSVESWLLKLNRDLLLTAKEAGVTLPR